MYYSQNCTNSYIIGLSNRQVPLFTLPCTCTNILEASVYYDRQQQAYLNLFYYIKFNLIYYLFTINFCLRKFAHAH